MDCAEAYLKHCLLHVLEHCDEDLAFFEKNVTKDNLRERLRQVATTQFARITYTEAVEHVLAANKTFEYPVEWGSDLQSEHERYLTEEVFKNTPVIVRDYPKGVKAFYMRENEDGKTVAAMVRGLRGCSPIEGGRGEVAGRFCLTCVFLQTGGRRACRFCYFFFSFRRERQEDVSL